MHRLELKCNTILLHILTTTYIVIFKDNSFFKQATVVRPTSYLDALRCIIIRTGMGAHKEPDIFGTLSSMMVIFCSSNIQKLKVAMVAAAAVELPLLNPEKWVGSSDKIPKQGPLFSK